MWRRPEGQRRRMRSSAWDRRSNSALNRSIRTSRVLNEGAHHAISHAILHCLQRTSEGCFSYGVRHSSQWWSVRSARWPKFGVEGGEVRVAQPVRGDRSSMRVAVGVSRKSIMPAHSPSPRCPRRVGACAVLWRALAPSQLASLRDLGGLRSACLVDPACSRRSFCHLAVADRIIALIVISCLSVYTISSRPGSSIYKHVYIASCL